MKSKNAISLSSVEGSDNIRTCDHQIRELTRWKMSLKLPVQKNANTKQRTFKNRYS